MTTVRRPVRLTKRGEAVVEVLYALKALALGTLVTLGIIGLLWGAEALAYALTGVPE